MDKRTKILAAAFGAVIAYAFMANVAYPNWIRPILTYDERIAERQEVLDGLLETEAEVNKSRTEYKRYVERNGSCDIAKVENQIREQLGALIELHNLKAKNVTPSRKTEDRKTGVLKMTVTVQAEGPLQGVAGLMKDVAELPYVLRFGNVAINPGKSTLKGGRPTLHEQVQVRLPIILWVLPQHPTVGRIDEATLAQADPVIRHQDRVYASLWAGRPFSEYRKPQQLRASAGDDHNLAKPGRTVVLRGSAKGGIGEYTVQWSPSDGVQNPTTLVTKVDTSKPGEFFYTLTVTDETGATSSDDVTVSVAEPKQVVKGNRKRSKAPPKPGEKRWKDGRYMQLVMVLGRTHHGIRTDEVMVYDRKGKESRYYAVGDEFDGGKLVSVHQTGGLVHRKDGYYVYPIGSQLDQDLRLADAGLYFELQTAAERHQANAVSEEEAKATEEAAKPDASSVGDAAKPPEAGGAATVQPGTGDTDTPTASGASDAAAQAPAVKKRQRPAAVPGAVGERKSQRRVPGQRPRPVGRKPK